MRCLQSRSDEAELGINIVPNMRHVPPTSVAAQAAPRYGVELARPCIYFICRSIYRTRLRGRASGVLGIRTLRLL